MSERTQRTATAVWANMNRRYNLEEHHKHDKRHQRHLAKYQNMHPNLPQEAIENANPLENIIEHRSIDKKIKKKSRLRIVKHNIH